MKISIAIDSRPGKGPKEGDELDIAKLLAAKALADVRILKRYRGGRYVSVEAPKGLYQDIKSAVGAGFVVSPQVSVEPL